MEARDWEECSRAAPIRKISPRKQDVSRRDRARRPCCNVDGHLHDVPRTHTVLHPQPLPVRRYDVGLDVRAARPGRCGTDRVDYGARLFCGPAGKTGHYEIDGVRHPRSRALPGAPRSTALGSGGFTRSGKGGRRLVRNRAPTVRECCDAIEECYEFMLAYAAQGLPD